jgi:1,2-diacylglycerol 3-beta-galactosyltransferase
MGAMDARREFSGGLKVQLCGFVTNMAEWMSASDVIVTKAGPGTIAEALICGLPIILNGFIPCQVPWFSRPSHCSCVGWLRLP